MLIAIRLKTRAVFLFGFAKNELDNIDAKRLAALQKIAASWLAADEGAIERAVTEGFLIEVKNGE